MLDTQGNRWQCSLRELQLGICSLRIGQRESNMRFAENEATETDELCHVEEVAEMLHMPRGTLRYYRHQGIGPRSFKIGRRVTYRRSVVLAWLAEQELVDPPTTPAA